jgi:hypothetical protein
MVMLEDNALTGRGRMGGDRDVGKQYIMLYCRW